MLPVTSAFIPPATILSRVTCFTGSGWATIISHLCLLLLPFYSAPSPHKCTGQSCFFQEHREQSVSLAPENTHWWSLEQWAALDARSGRHLGPLRLEEREHGDPQSHSDFWASGWDLQGRSPHCFGAGLTWQVVLPGFLPRLSIPFQKGTCGNSPPLELSGEPVGVRESCIEKSGEVVQMPVGSV